MKQANYRFSDEAMAIIEAKAKNDGISQTQAVNELILNSVRYNQSEMSEFIRKQNKLNDILMKMLGEDDRPVQLVKKHGRIPRKISVEGVVYDSVEAARNKLGISQSALAQRVKNHPDKYFYINPEPYSNVVDK